MRNAVTKISDASVNELILFYFQLRKKLHLTPPVLEMKSDKEENQQLQHTA